MDKEFNLLSCVVSQLSHDFPNLNIYTTKVEQGFKRPCIVVKIESCGFEKQLADVYFATFKLTIDYYGEDKTDIEAQSEYAQKLTLAVEYIKEPLIKALSVSQIASPDCNTIEAVYKLRVRQAPKQITEKMQKMEFAQRLGVKD